MDFKILEMRYFDSPKVDFFSKIERHVRDYEIDMELGDGRRYSCGDVSDMVLHKGAILVRRPKDVCSSFGSQRSYLLTLSFVNHVESEGYNRVFRGPFHPEYSNELTDNLQPIIYPNDIVAIKDIYKQLLMISDYETQIAKELVKELLFRLNGEICRKNYELLKPQADVCDKVISYMRKHLSQSVSLDEIANYVHLDKSYLIRLFKKKTGKTPIEALIDFKMEKAIDLVLNTDMKVTDIADACGYNSASFFISEYKKRYNVTPELHRNSLNGDEKL